LEFIQALSHHAIFLQGKRIVSIYFGGGTPSLLEADEIKRLLDSLFDALSKLQVTIDPHIEITLEVNPEDLASGSDHLTLGPYAQPNEQKRIKFNLLLQAGINRLSFGIQSLQDKELQLLSREHSSSAAIEAIHRAAEIGFCNISIDLIYDLPDQTLSSWIASLHHTSSLPITHLSLYNLAIEPHTSFYKRRHELALRMPKGEESHQMYMAAVEILASIGLLQYEISAFAKPGFHSRHNSGYWLGRNYIGFGPSASSLWNNRRYRNYSNLHRYRQLITLGMSGEDEVDLLDPVLLAHEQLILRLRLKQGVNLQEHRARYPELSTEVTKILEIFQARGFIEQLNQDSHQGLNSTYRLTYEGMRYFDHIAVELLP
jgi:oxygen-independent coproporphyrinogen-3 oxidase